MKLEELEEKIGYRFQEPKLLRQAMCHSSFANERHMDRLLNNERLEFLGDAVLELITSEFLFRNYPKMPEGEATRTRASIVCEQTLALCARRLLPGGETGIRLLRMLWRPFWGRFIWMVVLLVQKILCMALF